jgi:hypothetical protein
MRYLVYAVATTTALFAGGMLMSGRAEAAPLAPDGLRATADGFDILENAQFRLRGGNYCWYEGGWQGPGFSWCGYGSRHGFGRGGGQGW